MDWVILDLIKPVLVLIFALALLFFPEWSARRARRIHAEKLADRLAAGEDRYFEELRALQAYPPPAPSSLAWRIAGAALGTLSFAILYHRITD
ncbi:MAG TPA: hypothetical protein VIT45_18375 [Allosphingosinicella sp.]